MIINFQVSPNQIKSIEKFEDFSFFATFDLLTKDMQVSL
jgi:hypothetical protein